MAFKHRLTTVATAIVFSFANIAHAENHVDADTVVATVNGTEITLGHMIVLKSRLPAQYQQLPPAVLFEGILDQLVQQSLLGEEVKELSTGSRMTLENEERALRAAEAIQNLTNQAATDEALQAAYNDVYGSADPETEYNASHILVPTEEEAQSIIADLEAGADFAETAQEKSTGPSGPRGGELGWFGQGAMVAPFEQAVMAMEAGTISEPVQTQFGWHVIKLNETRLKSAPALEEVRGELMEKVRMDAIDARVTELVEGADIARSTADEIDPTLLDNISLLEN